MKAIVGMTWTPSERDATKYALEGVQELRADALNDLPASELEAIEAELTQQAGLVLEDVLPPADKRVIVSRALMWVTLRLRGVGMAWGDFDPQVRRTTFDFLVEDVDDLPPADSPDEISSPAEAE